MVRWPPCARFGATIVSPGREDREVDGHVGLGARVRLDVHVLGAEELLGPLDGELLDRVHVLAPAVVAAARIALGVLVGHDGADRLEHRLGDEVLRGDQLQVPRLALRLESDGLGDLGIDLLEPPHGRSSPVGRVVEPPPPYWGPAGGVKARRPRTGESAARDRALARPRRIMGAVSRLVRVASVGEIPVGRGKTVEVDGLFLAVFNAGGGRYHALSGSCPHEGGPLGRGCPARRPRRVSLARLRLRRRHRRLRRRARSLGERLPGARRRRRPPRRAALKAVRWLGDSCRSASPWRSSPAAAYGGWAWLDARHRVSTEDAYVEGSDRDHQRARPGPGGAGARARQRGRPGRPAPGRDRSPRPSDPRGAGARRARRWRRPRRGARAPRCRWRGRAPTAGSSRRGRRVAAARVGGRRESRRGRRGAGPRREPRAPPSPPPRPTSPSPSPPPSGPGSTSTARAGWRPRA